MSSAQARSTGSASTERPYCESRPVLVDDVAVAQLVHRAAVRRAVERDRELQLVGAHAQRRAGERDPLRVAGELELGLGGAQRREVDVAVAEDEHPPALDAAVHAAGHLEDLVAAEVRAGEHVAPALDHVGEARVVDDHRVEPAHVERALPGRGHGEHVRLLPVALEEGADDADRLAAVVVRGVDARVAHGHARRGLLDPGARGEEHPDPAPPLLHAQEEAVVEEADRRAVLDDHLGGALRVERVHLEHVGRVEVAGVELRVDRGRQPDEAAADRLPSARHSSSSADVWWISSTTSVSCGRMSPSWNQRRAMPVVTTITFHDGSSGVASRSRFTTPTRNGTWPPWPTISSAMGRMASVFPVPVPATMPKPGRRARARARARRGASRGRSRGAARPPARWSRRRRAWAR
jgi:hypothetical protein